MYSKLKSRKFWMAVMTALVLIANDGLGLNLPKDAIMAVAAVVISYVIGEGAVDAARALRK